MRLYILSTIVLVGITLAGCQSTVRPLIDVQQDLTQRVDAQRQKQENKTQALRGCQELCQQTLASDGQDFDQGPCLSNEIAPDWACDIIHQPRQEVDSAPENQCEAYQTGRVSHLVEVDGNCNVIRDL